MKLKIVSNAVLKRLKIVTEDVSKRFGIGNQDIIEKCGVCDKDVLVTSFFQNKCQRGHSVELCCATFDVISSVNCVMCQWCHASKVEPEKVKSFKLKATYFDSTNLNCPLYDCVFCGVPMQKQKFV